MWIFVVVIVLWGGWKMFELWDNYDKDKDVRAAEAEAASHFTPSDLPGMPRNLESTYPMAQKGGATGIRNWLKAYGATLQDPRKAWIELDYVVAVATQDPSEAKKVYADVKSRDVNSDRVKKRLKELAPTYK